MRRILLWVVLAGSLAACGTKGPLTLPQPQKAAPTASAPTVLDDSTRAGSGR